jgi:hypothetical protein
MRALLGAVIVAALLPLPAGAADAFIVEIVRSAPLKKEELFAQTVLWIAESFKSAREVIELKDRELGVVVGNGAVDMNIGPASFLPVNMPVDFKIRIDMKDNRYRMTFSQVKLIVNNRPMSIEDAHKSNEAPVRARFEQIANSLDVYLAKPRKDF